MIIYGAVKFLFSEVIHGSINVHEGIIVHEGKMVNERGRGKFFYGKTDHVEKFTYGKKLFRKVKASIFLQNVAYIYILKII